MKGVKQQRRLIVSAAMSASAVLLASHAPLLGQDAFTKYYTTGVGIGGSAPAPSSSSFYHAYFSPNQGFARMDYNGSASTWAATLLVSNTDMDNFERSSSVAGTGTVPVAASGGLAIMGDIVLNPAPLTIMRTGVLKDTDPGPGVTLTPDPNPTPVNYPAGTLGLIIDQPTNVLASSTIRYDYTKIGYFFDLRQVGSALTPAEGVVDRAGNGTVNWNDVFEPIFSKADLRSVAGYTLASASNTSHHPTYSSDGQSAYFIDHSASSVTGGLYKINLASTGTAALTRLISTPGGFNSEPSVVASSVRNFGGGTGDQVVFIGASDFAVNPNPDGISYIVDNGTPSPTAQTLLSRKQLQGFFETTSAPNALSTGADAAGNVYFYNQTEGGVFKYDANNLLSKVFSRAEQIAFDTTTGGATSSTITTLDMKFRDISYTAPAGPYTVKQLLYSDSTTGIRGPAGVTLFEPGDFNRDGKVDSTDADDFKLKLGLHGATAATVGNSTPFTQTAPGNLKYDLNGSTLVSGNQVVAIDWKDVKIFQKSAGLSSGDVNLSVGVDYTDLGIIATNYNDGNNKLFTQGNLTSVRIAAIDKDTVNYADLITIAANWTLAKPNAGDLSGYSTGFIADATQAFGVGTGGLPHRFLKGGSSAWSTASNWSNGLPDGIDEQAHLLTDPDNDVTLNVDGNYTIGQLNFDNYFSYTLSGAGSLRMQVSAGKAQIYANAASPTISAGLIFKSETNVTIAYAEDTLGLLGSLTNNNAGVGQTIHKLGAGTLTISGTQSHAPGAAFIASAGVTNFASDANGNLGVTVNSTATVNFKTTQSLAALSVTGSGLAAVDAGANKVIRTGTVSASGAGKINLRDNKLIATASPVGTWNGSSYTDTTALIASGRNGGGWGGNGIITTLTAATAGNYTSIGIALGSEVKASTVSETALWAGQTITGGDTLVMYTYGGDATLDGKINVDDYIAIDNAIAAGLTGWSNGDFNYDGKVNIDDYTQFIDANIVTQGGAFPTAGGLEGVTAVPEPSAMACLFAGSAIGLLARGRRRAR